MWMVADLVGLAQIGQAQAAQLHCGFCWWLQCAEGESMAAEIQTLGRDFEGHGRS